MAGTNDSAELQKFISIESEWKTLNTAYASTEADDIPTQLRLVLTNAQNANDALAGNQFGIGNVEISITEAEIQDFSEKTTNLKEFTQDVHGDVDELIDTPFETALSDVLTNTESINQAGYSQDEGGLNAEISDIMSTINGVDNETKLDEASLGKTLCALAASPEFGSVINGIKEAITNKGSYKFTFNGYRYIVENGKLIIKDAKGTFHTRDQAAEFIEGVVGLAEGKGKWGEYASLVKRSGIKVNKLDPKDVNVAFETLVKDVKEAGSFAKYRKGMVLNSFKDSYLFADGVELIKAASKEKKLAKEAAQAGKELADTGSQIGKGLSKGTKVVKSLGIVGDLVTVGTDIADNIHKDENGKVDIKTAVVGSAVDIGVDCLSGMGTAAAGAAVGSLFLPPLGTVVGAAVGIGLDYVINKDFDLDRDGESHSLIGATKDGLHNLFGIG